MKREELLALTQVVSANYADPVFNIAGLAGKLGVSTSFLREMIYTAFGISPQRLLETFRLEHALTALAQEGGVIDTVRRKAGYAYAKSFRRAFKKRTGMTPQECKARFARADDKEKELNRALARLRRSA